MPEGDTIFRAARTLHRALAGRLVASFESVLPALARIDEDEPIAGRTVLAARAVGKHLLVEFSGDLTLRTHMRMNGEWHIYRPGERWQRPRIAMRVAIATDEYVAVGFNIPVAEFVRTSALGRHRELSRLGPDLLADDFDEARAVSRLRASRAPTVGDALLDQGVMAGVGNVFKSEVLFVGRIDPFRAPATLTEDEARRIVGIARELMRANVVAAPSAPSMRAYRQTTRAMNPAARLWVYGRGGRACRLCGTPIASAKQGESARLTYWCPACQQ